MGILWFIIVGFIAGLLARALMPGDDKMSWGMTLLLGIGGAGVAWLLGNITGLYSMDESGPGIIASTIGAIILLAVGRLVQKKRHRGRHAHA